MDEITPVEGIEGEAPTDAPADELPAEEEPPV